MKANIFSRSRVANLETLERRIALSVDLQLSGTQTIVPYATVNVSNDPARLQSEMSLDVNPTNPLNVVGISHALGGGTPPIKNAAYEIDVFSSIDGGASWRTRRLTHPSRFGEDNAPQFVHVNDSRPDGVRFDPTIAINAKTGEIFVGYSVVEVTGNQTLVVGRSTDGGDTWQFSTVLDEPRGGPFDIVLDKFHLATGADPSQPDGRAAYITYSIKVQGTWQIWAAGTNYQGTAWQDDATWTLQRVSDTAGELHFADPAVGPGGQLYVTWLDVDNKKIMVDFDSDGLFSPTYGVGSDSLVRDLVTVLNQTPVPAQPRRGLFNALMMDVDVSARPTRGRIHVAFVDHRAPGTPTKDVDIYVGWADWSATAPIPTEAWQFTAVESDTTTDFNPWLDVDQLTGSVNVIYYRSQENDGATDSEVHVYARTNINDGQGFGSRQRLSMLTSDVAEVDGSYDRDYLEYIGLAAHGGTLHALWAHADGANDDMEAYYTHAHFASQTNANQLIVTGDDQGPTADDIRISYSPANLDYVSVQVNGVVQYVTLEGSISKIIITAGQLNDMIVASLDIVIEAYGGPGNDEITGGALADFLYGEDGNDELYGNDAAVELYGGNGNDLLYGGDGNDIIRPGPGADQITPGPGIDWVLANETSDGIDRIWAQDGWQDALDIDLAEDQVVTKDPIDWIF